MSGAAWGSPWWSRRCRPNRVRVRQAALDEVLAHARETAPNECCGLLLGTPQLIVTAFRARNVHDSAVRYLINPEDHFAAIRAARQHDLTVVGAYHSHPASQPIPSATDLDEAHDPQLLYVIVGPVLGEGSTRVRAYRLLNRNFQEAELVPES